MPFNTHKIFKHYIACALWCSTDDQDQPLEDNYTQDDLDDDSKDAQYEQVYSFVAKNEKMLEASRLSDELIGHNLWLTRNGHGAGFWDRDLGPVGDALTVAAHALGEVDLYVGDDSNLYT